jgi:phthiocerol/phenolphthiocerol synthesis type-I polyketide synthase E
MAQLPRRLAELSPERHRLLERLLAGAEAAQPPRADRKAADAASVRQDVLGPHKTECRSFYDGISRRLDASDLGPFSMFLNLGYAETGTPSHSVVELPEWCLNKNSVRLVLEVIGRCGLAGRRVLDVGCGRGGSISVIKQYFAARSAVGLDLAPAAIKFCRATHRYPDVTFEVGDAERLPFPDHSFDVVVNIESSSTYPDIGAFYHQVFRVLTPGGYFLYTDALPVGRFAECTDCLRRLGLSLELDRDITPNVLASCGEIAAYRLDAYRAQGDRAMSDFLGAPGTQFYDEMKRGEWTYRIHRWKKPAAPGDRRQ